MREEIGPKIDKLKEERMQYVEFQRIERELEHSKRVYYAWRYVVALRDSKKVEENVKIVEDKINSKLKKIAAGKKEIENIEEKYAELLKKKEAVCIFWFSSFFMHLGLIIII